MAIGIFFLLVLVWCGVEWLRVKLGKWWESRD